jgi:hypothetical protein
MPIYEYYCPDNHRIYQFFAKTLAQGRSIPQCPDNPAYRMRKMLSSFAITGAQRKSKEGKGTSDLGNDTQGAALPGTDDSLDNPRMEAAMGEMEKEMSSIDENDPRSMGRMMRRMSELTGEKMEGEMEEVVRKLEEGMDPDKLEDQLGGAFGDEGPGDDDPYGMGGEPPGGTTTKDPKEPRHRYKIRRGAPTRDPKLYDYE